MDRAVESAVAAPVEAVAAGPPGGDRDGRGAVGGGEVVSIREAAEGGAPMSPDIARRVVAVFRQVRPPRRADYDLTPHELRLLTLLVEGHSYKTAGGALGVSYNTICFHIKNIYSKLHVHSKSEAVTKALRHGIT